MADRHSEAFRLASEDDWTADDADREVYPDDDPRPVRLPEDHEADEWDRDKDGPKTPDEARAALAARIANPRAPDDMSVAGAYDDLGD